MFFGKFEISSLAESVRRTRALCDEKQCRRLEDNDDGRSLDKRLLKSTLL
jgi:hypothetical protein